MEVLTGFFSPVLIWFIIGLAFVLLEFLIPGVIVIFFGIGAWVTSFILLFGDFGINTQLVIFLLTSIILIIILRKKVQSIFVGKSEEGDIGDIDNIIGKKVKVSTKISPNENGKVILNGTNWSAESDSEINEGEIVEIIKKDNITLIVKPLN